MRQQKPSGIYDIRGALSGLRDLNPRSLGPQRRSNLVLHGQGLHLPVFAPAKPVSGGIVRSVSMFSGGRCGQICGRSSTLPRARQIAVPRERLYRNSDCQISQVILSQAGAAASPRCHSERSEAEPKNPFFLPGQKLRRIKQRLPEFPQGVALTFLPGIP